MNYKLRLKNITTFVLDVDGVLTDGMVLLEASGEMSRTMNTRDGYAIQYAVKKGYNFIVITGGNSEMVVNRLNYLGVTEVYSKAKDKLTELKAILNKKNLSLDEVLYVGDDLPDYHCMIACAIGCCPYDSVPEIREIADYISHVDGGKGCVREIIEQVLKAQGKWFTAEEKSNIASN